jgi:hypothetical protein
MNDSAPAIFVALEQSGFAAAIRQSPWIYPAANVGHIVSLTFFAGAIAVMDVRLLGGLSATAPAALLVRARNFAVAALAGMAVTGFFLFSAEASHLVLNPVFQLKAILVAAGLVNIAIYEFLGQARGRAPRTGRINPGARQSRRCSLTHHLGRGRRLRAQHCLFLNVVMGGGRTGHLNNASDRRPAFQQGRGKP